MVLLGIMTKKDKPDLTFRHWITERSLCGTCGRPGVLHDDGSYYLDPSHIKSKGSGGKDASNLIPQCRPCHTKYHSMGRKRYEMVYDINLEELAKYYWELYLESCSTHPETS